MQSVSFRSDNSVVKRQAAIAAAAAVSLCIAGNHLKRRIDWWRMSHWGHDVTTPHLPSHYSSVTAQLWRVMNANPIRLRGRHDCSIAQVSNEHTIWRMKKPIRTGELKIARDDMMPLHLLRGSTVWRRFEFSVISCSLVPGTISPKM